ncbi:MAG: type I restriction enzyme HsdR N-terminal domain-containing protein [Clostridia bacterium]|nr:type I restriction enzyme HsdR N-terminal domain-containing protein [Clostridia bacterium]
MPEPKSAFFIGGSKDDKFLASDADTITCWQCNPDTRAGDMIVMYLRTPVSAVDSVWRSVSIGFNDPFFYYYRCTYIAHPVSIKQISQKQLQKDKIFKDVPIVRKNMQGINGVELMPSEYNYLMELAKADVPRLEFVVTDGNQDFVNEKDVENKLIKPLIAKLGYSEEEYVQQLYIEIGNHNHALIPDFVLLPVTTRGHQSAFALIEAKHSIPNLKEMEEVRIQARSYAKQLNVKYSVIASKDKVWVYAPDDDFTKEIFSASWGELNDADTFSHLLKLIGKRAGN